MLLFMSANVYAFVYECKYMLLFLMQIYAFILRFLNFDLSGCSKSICKPIQHIKASKFFKGDPDQWISIKSILPSADLQISKKMMIDADVGNVGFEICSYICNLTSIHLTALQSLKIQNSSNSNKIGSCCHEEWHQSRIWHLFKKIALGFFGRKVTWLGDNFCCAVFFPLVKTNYNVGQGRNKTIFYFSVSYLTSS